MLITHVVGARPNFMKVAPIWRALQNRGGIRQALIHTGQHYDHNMSDIFFTQLGLPAPDVHLGVGSGSHAQQTAKVMAALDDVFTERRPDLLSVVGDVNSTMAAALVASKSGITVAHVEAGLRSGDRTMPEEINRVVTDHICDLLLAPSRDGADNLRHEGIPESRISVVGNVMIDTLLHHLAQAKAVDLTALRVDPEGFVFCTLHRPSNVDDDAMLSRLVGVLLEVAGRMPVVFPTHPRTRARLEASGLMERVKACGNIRLTDPVGYVECVGLMSRSRLVLTDSGGVQEESTALRVPCLTLRENTERPVTVSVGSNVVVGTSPRRIMEGVEDALRGPVRRGNVPELWDGHTADRIADVYQRHLGASVS